MKLISRLSEMAKNNAEKVFRVNWTNSDHFIFDQNTIILWISETILKVIVPLVLEKIDKPLVEVRHIRSSIEIINNCFFINSDSPVT